MNDQFAKGVDRSDKHVVTFPLIIYVIYTYSYTHFSNVDG